ncbi:MAG: hypothetical protein B1H02_07025 [Candidatus Latescibacteria bacterium 4484_107]|nr:MAG: hypothetical protein B1H02_07025 [Candidatus Latescibacteria bacterium 4484_107]
MKATSYVKIGTIAVIGILLGSGLPSAHMGLHTDYFTGDTPAEKASDAPSDRAKEMGQLLERSAEGALWVGMATVDITPDWAVLLPYGKAEPVTETYGDPCYVKALVLQVGDLRVALVEMDIIGIHLRDADAVKEVIAAETGISRDYIILAATHNHAYPRVTDRRAKDDKVRKLLAKRSAEVVKQAMEGMFPAKIGVGKRTLRRDIVNNREKLMGPTFTDLYVIRVDDMAGNVKGVFFDFGAHPVIFTKSWGPQRVGEVGPDWPGYARTYIELEYAKRMLWPRYNEAGKDYAPTIFTMFAEGAAGDQVGLGISGSRNELNGVRMHVKQAMTETIAGAVLEMIGEIKTKSELRMAFRAKVIPLSFRKDLPSGHPRRGRLEGTLIQTLTFDEETVIAMIPGEVVADVAIHFREHCGFENAILVTLANDAVGYIVTEAEVLEKVTYAGKGSRFDHTRARGIIGETIRMVNPAYTPDPPFDPERGFGAISGKVDYPGDEKVLVGVIRRPQYPSSAGPPFWGKRILVDDSGAYRIDNLLPGEKFVYVREVAKDYAPGKERGKDKRTFFYGRKVPVWAGETTEHVDFHIPEDFFETEVKSLKLEEDAVRVEGNTIRGRVQIAGKVRPNERITAGIHPYGAPYILTAIPLRNPYLVVPVEVAQKGKDGATGTFAFPNLPPGRYVLSFLLDVNKNAIPEPRVDVVGGPYMHMVFEVKE